MSCSRSVGEWGNEPSPSQVSSHFGSCRGQNSLDWDIPYIIGKLLTRATTLLQTSFPLEVCTQNYGPPKLQESQPWEFWDSHLGVLGQNAIWMWASWRGTKYTIRGKVVASPKFRLWFVLWVRVCPWFVLTPKCSSYALTNLLFGLCRSVWIIDACHSPSPHPRALACPSTPKVLRTKECAPTPYSFVVSTLYSYLSL
jgi:hypothetical protein